VLVSGGSGPSLTVAGAPPPSLSKLALAWGMAGSMRAARNATPERSFMVQGWATRPVILTGWPWRIPEDRTPGTLTPIRSALSSPMTRS